MLPVWTFTPDAPPRVEFLCTSSRMPEEDVDPCFRCDFGEHLLEPSAICVIPGGLSPEGFGARITVGPEYRVAQVRIESGGIDSLQGPEFVQHAASGRRNGHSEGAGDRSRRAHQNHSVAPTGEQCSGGAARGPAAEDDDVDLVQFWAAQPQPVPHPWKPASALPLVTPTGMLMILWMDASPGVSPGSTAARSTSWLQVVSSSLIPCRTSTVRPFAAHSYS